MLRGKALTIAETSEHLETQSRQISKSFRISCYPDVAATYVKLSDVIRDKAKDFDLIVMGTDGPDDLYQFFTGSNTYNVLVKTETPLLLIPQGYLYSQINHIAYAFDYVHEGILPLSGLIPFVRHVNGRLTVLQVTGDKYTKAAEDQLMEQQQKIRSYYDDEVSIEFVTLRSDDAAQSVNSYVLTNEPDALALCTKHRNFLGRLFHKSLIRKISAYCNYPVFVFHQ